MKLYNNNKLYVIKINQNYKIMIFKMYIVIRILIYNFANNK